MSIPVQNAADALSDDGIARDQRPAHLARLTGRSVNDARSWLAVERLPPFEVLQAIVGALDLPRRS